MAIIASLPGIYIQYNDLEKGKNVASEMEKLEDEYSTASKTAKEYLNARSGDKSSEAFRIRSIDMLSKTNISNKSETQQNKR